ncbi:MAG TPA: peptide chain release factor N(5)-glutamine methyltransferase [Dongiaceae bacterium]
MTAAVSIAAVLARATRSLADGGIEASGREARLLLQHAAAIPVATQIAFAERLVAPAEVAAFDLAVARRLRREPLSHILGHREFWSLSFQVTPDTLDPRADSETLVEAVLAELNRQDAGYRQKPLTFVDFGTGTGCLLLALLSELPAAQGLGIDLNPGAVAIATANARRLDLSRRAKFQHGDWDQGIAATFDVVMSNPPYIPSNEIADLQPEVARFEPHLALDGGADGLTAYRALAQVIKRVLKPGGIAALEIGAGQGPDVIAVMATTGLQHIVSAQDLHAHERVLIFR